ncbi:MmgE/PrpD family protein [Advenella alkanexedens]|uniref:MmgE/PrpD family protein n=1 Tax=Advenella alkanexedens TaxID=1481665 RepID=A0ABS6NML0_9BURK|nr:MmgE/PrpD family protein [Advenella alkanexedens]MBV4396828.1 MmgE/PrpD family protein [Advenella alkanexedens]
MTTQSEQLATFAANLQFSDIPAHVIARCEDLLLDTLGSILAGSTARPVKTIDAFAKLQGPTTGKSQVLGNVRNTTALFASLVNAAAAHMVEQDDVHNGSVFHPAAVVFPPALAVAQEIGASGKELLTACVAGYEVGIRVGEFLGRSHYRIFHTTGTAGTIAAAVTVGRLLKLNPEQMLDAIGSAGTQAAGLWEFLRTAADSKQLHTAKAAANGLIAAYLAKDGFTGAKQILEGAQGMGAGMSTDADPRKLVDGLGTRWALPETSFKYHASCRHTHPAADALQVVMKDNNLSASDIASVVTHVHQGAIDVLGAVVKPETVHQSKFSMGTVLALIAIQNFAGLAEFDAALHDEQVGAFREKVTMELDEEVDTAYPNRWIGKVTVTTNDGRVFKGRVDEPKGDPSNTLSRPEIEDKVMRLGQYENAASTDTIKHLIDYVWDLQNKEVIEALV